MSKAIYETWGSAGGREGIQRTLSADSAADLEFLDEGFRVVDEHGVERKLTVDEANKRGIRRCVAARDIHTGEMKFRGDDLTPIFSIKAGRS